MKRLVVILLLILGAGASLRAQDSLATAPVDSTLLGRNILMLMGPGVQISQSAAIGQALDRYIQDNAEKPIQGFRIRVFCDNGPQARSKSENIEVILKKQLDVEVYRSFESPNYKVLIGNFRSKDEALRIYNALKKTYPTAYIIKDNIEYPL